MTAARRLARAFAAGLAVATAGLLAVSGCRRTASLQVDSSPPGAEIWIDGESTGLATPHLLDNLYAGFHTVRVVRSELADREDTLDLVAGETLEVCPVLPEVRWKDNHGAANPSVGPDRCVYVASGQSVCRIGPDGRLDWESALPGGASPLAVGPDGMVYALTDNALCAVGSTGARAWTYTLEYPLYHGQAGVALAGNGSVYVAVGRYLYALSGQGVVTWILPLPGAAVTAPAIGDDGTIYVQAERKLVAVTPGGAIAWLCGVDWGTWQAGALAIGRDGTIYTASETDLFAVAGNGRLAWDFHAGAAGSGCSPVIGGDGTIYVILCDSLFAVSPDGTRRWAQGGYHRYHYSAAAVGSDGSIFVQRSVDKRLCALNSAGDYVWGIRSPSFGWSAPAITDDSMMYASEYRWTVAVKLACAPADSPWPMYQHDPEHSGRAGSKMTPRTGRNNE